MTSPTMNIPDSTDWISVNPAFDSFDADVRHRCEVLGWYTLAALCAYRIGVCATEVRPVAAGCIGGSMSWLVAPVMAAAGYTSALPLQTIGGLYTPYITGGMWVNACGCGPHLTSCTCDGLSAVYLPGPVGQVEWVKVDGEIIDPVRYRVDEGNRLVSVDPALVWPVRPDMAAAADEPGSFVVRYYRGAAPNELTNYAAAILANEFYLERSDTKKCRLPRGTTALVQRGATIDLGTDFWESILTTIPEISAVVNIFNPHHNKMQPRVVTPESRRRQARSTTWGAL